MRNSKLTYKKKIKRIDQRRRVYHLNVTQAIELKLKRR